MFRSCCFFGRDFGTLTSGVGAVLLLVTSCDQMSFWCVRPYFESRVDFQLCKGEACVPDLPIEGCEKEIMKTASNSSDAA